MTSHVIDPVTWTVDDGGMDTRIDPPPVVPRPLLIQLIQLWALTMVAFGLAIAAVPWVRETLFPWMARGDADFDATFGEIEQEYLTFNQALMGSLTAGLGLAVFWLAREALARGERWGWTAIATSVGLWFVVDSAASIATGFGRNAISNVVLVAPLLPLLWLIRPATHERRVTDVSADPTGRPHAVHTGDTSSP
jgi:hypothetical protein